MLKSRFSCSMLVAMPQLEDRNFHHAVILLLEHGNHGAMGLTINHLNKMQLHEALEDQDIPEGIPTWNAGPVDPHLGFVLHNQPEKPFELEVSPGAYLSSSHELIGHMVDELKEGHQRYPYRLLTGYAGWGSGQLEEEIENGYWRVVEGDFELLFNTPAQELWTRCLAKAGVKSELYVN